MKVALDTNLLAYAEGVDDAQRRAVVLELLRVLPRDATFVPVQVLGELFNVLVRKAKRPREAACAAVLDWRNSYPLLPTTAEALFAATDLAADHGLGIWDAVILAVASRAGCRLLLTEDLQQGFAWGGVTVANPFVAQRHPLLEDAVAGAQGRALP